MRVIITKHSVWKIAGVFRPSEIAVGQRSQLTTDVMALRRDEHEAPTRGIKESMGGLGKRGDAEQSDVILWRVPPTAYAREC